MTDLTRTCRSIHTSSYWAHSSWRYCGLISYLSTSNKREFFSVVDRRKKLARTASSSCLMLRHLAGETVEVFSSDGFFL